MRFTESHIPGAYQVDLDRREDERGFFARAWCAQEFARHGLNPHVEQLNVGFSRRKGTLRGMHFQRQPHAECKAVRCIRGRIFDVAVDLRPDSPGYRRWFGTELSAENGRMLVIPEGCAHGYLTLVDDSEILYTTSCAYAPDCAGGVRWDDPAFGIDWPFDPVVLSDQDARWPDFPRED